MGWLRLGKQHSLGELRQTHATIPEPAGRAMDMWQNAHYRPTLELHLT